MNPESAFAFVARFTVEAAAPDFRKAAFESLAVVAGQMNLTTERDHALEVVESLHASEAKQLKFEALIRAQLSPEAGR